MALYSDEYRQLQERLHADRADYGTSGSRHVDVVLNFAQQLATKDILDWACGKATLQKGLPFPIQNFDPFVLEYVKRPEPADLVVVTDVMEHIEPDCLDDVLADIAALTKKLCYMTVATRPAVKVLADGRNAHLIQEPPRWWLPKLLYHFDLHSFQNQKGEFTVLLVKNGSQDLPREPQDAVAA